MVLRFACRLDKLCHHMGRGRQIGVADPEGYATWVARPPIPPDVASVGLRQEPNLERIAELVREQLLAVMREEVPDGWQYTPTPRLRVAPDPRSVSEVAAALAAIKASERGVMVLLNCEESSDQMLRQFAALDAAGVADGHLSLELGGHFVGTADPADHLYAALLERQIRTLMLE